MKNFTKYITSNEESENWGIYIHAIGSHLLPPNESYPLPNHPDKYSFNWELGRVLDDYHLLYITHGKGVFEDKNKTYNVVAGDMILLKSGEWHRYKPDVETGWQENFIGFNGEVAQHFIEKVSGYSKSPVFSLGKNESMLILFERVFDIVENEKLCFQLTASAVVINILSRLVSFIKQQDFDSSSNKSAEIINEVRFLMIENVEKDINLQEISEDLNIAYSYFRKIFKKYTGFSPRQYHLHLKINKAKELLLETNKSVKEISFELGFKSTNYFGRVFKQKTGKNPSDMRKQNTDLKIY